MSRVVPPFPCEEFGAQVFSLRPPMALRLLLKQPPEGLALEALPDPFARWDLPSAPSRMLLAELTVAGVAKLGVGLTLDDPGFQGAEQRFERHRQGVEALLAPAPAGAPRLLPFLGRDPADGTVRRYPPLFLCKRRRLFFIPPCPGCGAALAECRDAEQLAAAGLVTGSTPAGRYLWCAAQCGDAPHRFYTAEKDSAAPATVGDRWQLVAAFAELLAGDGEAATALPCNGCPDVDGCYPGQDSEAGDAARLLVPLAFYGFAAVAQELFPLHLDEFFDHLGGRSWQELAADLGEARELDRIAWLAVPGGPPATARKVPTRGFEGDKKWLEVLLNKLLIFQDLCTQVTVLHKRLGRPHLGLSPAAVCAGWPPAPGETLGGPGCGVGLLGLDAAVPLEGDFEDRAEAYRPPAALDPLWAHPAAVAGVSVQESSGRLQLTTVAADAQAGGLHLAGRLTLLGGMADRFGSEDRVEVVLGRSQGLRREYRIAFRCSGSVRDGLALEAELAGIDAGDATQLESLRALPHVDVACRVVRGFGIECDLYSLGMLWLRGLLGNAEHAAQDMVATCREVVQRLEAAAGTRTTGPPPNVAELLRGELRKELFHPRQLLYRPAGEETAEVGPVALWERALALGFRLATQIPAFSYWHGALATAPEEGRGPEELLAQDLSELRGEVERALFLDPPGLDRELRDILSGLLRDPALLDVAVDTPPAPGARDRGLPADVAVAPDAEGDETLEVPPRSEPDEAARQQPAATGDALPETVELSRRPAATPGEGAAPTGESATAEDAAEDDFEKTVILKPGARATQSAKPGSADRAPRSPPVAPPESEDREAGAEEQEPASSPSPEEEDLESTIILKPIKRPGSR